MSAEQLITKHLDIWTSAHKTRSSAGRGSSSKLDLYGIKKLRELIFELAVRGKLTPQDSNDEPVTVLMDRIQAEINCLIKNKKIKKSTFPKPISFENMPYSLPDGWKWVNLSQLGHIFSGNSINSDIKESKYTGLSSGFPFIATKDVGYGWEEINYENGVKIPSGESKFIIAPSNSVLICAEGGSAGKKCGVTTKDICFGNKLFAISLYDGTYSKYVLINYLSPSFYQRFSNEMTGIIGGISLASFSELLIPLPPLSEQQRIVTKVDELMAFCDQLEQAQTDSIDAHAKLVEALLTTLTDSKDHQELQANWQRIAEHFDTLFTTEESIDQLKQTILQLAFMGKLVPQDPNDEPASELLKKIAAEKAHLIKEGKIKKEKPLPFISAEEMPFELPNGWAWSRLISLGDDFGGGTPSKANPEFWNGNIPWVSPKDMKTDYIFDAQDLITENAVKNSTTKLIPSNSLLLVVRGMILAHSFPVAINKVPVTINQDMKALVFSHVSPDYLLLVIKGMKNTFVNLVEHSSHGTCKIVSEKLWNVVIAVPPTNEQHRIVSKVEELMSICDTLKSNLKKMQISHLVIANVLVEYAVR